MNTIAQFVRLFVSLAVLMGFPCGSLCYSGEIGEPTYITQIRPCIQANDIQIHVESSDLCGTEVFRIYMDERNGKEAYAAALAAFLAKKRAQLEVSNQTGCTGWGTKLQSIFILD